MLPFVSRISSVLDPLLSLQGLFSFSWLISTGVGVLYFGVKQIVVLILLQAHAC